ncbi:MAG: tripartite tricarboxylate transporter substrate binding protein [Rubrivivax sp.]|nr:tripartite tricarboxylate transporter substrate binding protein [Rubrivivax sp.]
MNPGSRGLRRRVLLGAAAGAACASAAGASAARVASFPSRAVRIVVPYAVGIGPDVVARGIAQHLSRLWAQPVLIDNKPGASGIVAFGDVRRTAADGHTLYLADTATLAVNPLLHSHLPYDPVRDLVPLTLLFHATFLIWAGSRNRLRSIAELQDAARREPERVSYGSLGHGHASHVAIESYARAAGLRLLHVPFKDAGSLFTAVASGEVDFTAFSMNSLAGLMAAGRVRPLAVAARRRLASHPDIPTLAEAGGPPVEMHPWAALVALAGTPAPVLAQLQRDVTGVMARPDVRQLGEQTGFEITPSTPQALRERIAADIAAYRPLVDEGRVARL